MLVLKTTSPNVSPSAPKPRPVKTVPSSRASFATISAIHSPRSGGREILLTIASRPAKGHARKDATDLEGAPPDFGMRESRGGIFFGVRRSPPLWFFLLFF